MKWVLRVKRRIQCALRLVQIRLGLVLGRVRRPSGHELCRIDRHCRVVHPCGVGCARGNETVNERDHRVAEALAHVDRQGQGGDVRVDIIAVKGCENGVLVFVDFVFIRAEAFSEPLRGADERCLCVEVLRVLCLVSAS